MANYYHYLTTRNADGSTRDRVIGSAADNIDDAHRERCKIAAQYHPDKLVALSTHNAGTGPACREPGAPPQCGPES